MNGIVYALTNPAMPGIVKIGKTGDLGIRLNQLYSTGVPTPFDCIYAKEVSNAAFVERRLHAGLSSKRLNDKREFFTVVKQEVVSLFDLISGTDITPGKQVEPDEWEETYKVRLPSGEELEGSNIADLCNQLEAGDYCYTYSKYSTIISRRNKGWTMEQSFGFEVPPNYTEVNKLLQQGYSYFPDTPKGDDNTKPIVLHSKKIIYISQKHFAEEHGIPTDYVSDKLKAGWDADKILQAYTGRP